MSFAYYPPGKISHFDLLNINSKDCADSTANRVRIMSHIVLQDCLETLLQALVQKGMREEMAAPLLERLRATNVPISGRLMVATLGDAHEYHHPRSKHQYA